MQKADFPVHLFPFSRLGLSKNRRKADIIFNGNYDLAIKVSVKFGVAYVIVLKKALIKKQLFIGTRPAFFLRAHSFTSLKSNMD